MRNTTITATFCLGVALALFPSGCDGFQAGLQRFGYAMFFMNDAALAYLHNTGGWEIGVGPSVVIVDEGMAKSLTTSTLRDDIYAFVFNQTGLMAGAGLQGSKITEIQPWAKLDSRPSGT